MRMRRQRKRARGLTRTTAVHICFFSFSRMAVAVCSLFTMLGALKIASRDS